jgi:cytochrome c oxidase cbb3-type subunit 4
LTYDALRHFADSYGLGFMVILWLLFCAWAMRPGARDRSREAARLILEDDEDG